MRFKLIPFLLAGFVTFLIAPADAAAAHPCSEIAKKCRKEGYSIGGANSSGQGLVKDCLEKVLAGQTLPGISVNFKTVGECKVRFDRRVAAGQKPSRRLSADEGETARPRRESTGFVEYTGAGAGASSSASGAR